MNLWPFNRAPKTEAKSLTSPSDWLNEIFGVGATNYSGVTLSVDAALRVPAVASAIRVISEAAASLDVMVKEKEGRTETDLPDDPILPLLRDQANEWTSGYELIRDLVIDALISDVGGLAWVNRVDGRPVEIIHYARGVIAVEYDLATREPKYTINSQPVPASNIIHLRSPFGRAPMTLAREAIGVAHVLERHAARLFGRGARPSGALKFPKGMGEESVKKAREAWRLTHEGNDSGGRTAILFDGAEFESFQLASTDAQFLENRKFEILEIARAFRVPPSMLFELDRATWSNTEQMGREFLIYCLEPWLRALEAAFRRGLFLPDERDGRVIRFDRDDLTRADLNTRATVINSLISSRTINPNEGRQWLGLQPYEGGDEFTNPNITTDAPADPQESDDATE
ncbi:phage portal protein [Tranquillimonas alkanivorans]|uniref:Phage portal protein, HK97 family n=1 Tax=Tranquillimonas alkanivorans TaxID=441119 RepID=A0A1I5RWH5_9RHOB|nr:phage portal protein [Tranquillimonas alkanivorans]SFP62919.1 phage portal protein, HK97 family [Tranquillimonas alkanivorans]